MWKTGITNYKTKGNRKPAENILSPQRLVKVFMCFLFTTHNDWWLQASKTVQPLYSQWTVLCGSAHVSKSQVTMHASIYMHDRNTHSSLSRVWGDPECKLCVKWEPGRFYKSPATLPFTLRQGRHWQQNSTGLAWPVIHSHSLYIAVEIQQLSPSDGKVYYPVSPRIGN